MARYQKFCYWLSKKDMRETGESLGKAGMSAVEETRIPCRVLRASMEVGIVPPEAWEGFCKRRTSWCRTSRKAGLFLVVSTKPLDISGPGDRIVIVESHFRPDILPSPEEIEKLAGSTTFQEAKPEAWDRIAPVEIEFYQRWYQRFGGPGPFNFGKILMAHSANHANFIDPRFFVLPQGAKAPYSIADSLHTCSSCLEFFDILGEKWPLKYVIPCLGAVQFAHLPRDRYFRVSAESIKKGQK